MQHDFSGKTVLITGASGDMGRPLVDTFRECGAEVFATDLRSVDVPNFTQGDISDPEFVKAWVANAVAQTGRIDVLVNVAGICARTPLNELTADNWDKMLAVNLRSVFLMKDR